MLSARNHGFTEGLDVEHLLTTSKAQDIHISCPRGLVRTLIAEFEQQLADNPDVEVYDWGWSYRFQQGYVVLSWKGCVPLAFKQQLDADPRLEGHTVYDLPSNLVVPLIMAERL